MLLSQNYKELSLFSVALIVSSLFLLAEWHLPETHQEKIGTGHAWLGQAYNFYKYGVSNVVSDTTVRIKKFQLYDTEMLPPQFNTVSIYDPIFYSAFCALLWQLLGSANLCSLKILNIILFSFLMIWLFRVLLLLFDDKSKVFVAAFSVLLYFPLLYTNIAIPRDVHHYYFFVIFFYFMLTYVLKNKKIPFLIPGALLVVFCQWVRPPLLSSLVVLSALMLFWAWLEPSLRKKTCTSLSIFWLTSLLLFWLPFCAFNKITYNRYFLSALGENMLSSLYGAPLPNGDALEHSMGKFVLRKTGNQMTCGSIASDTICMDLYKEYIVKYPLHSLKCMYIRLKAMLWYDLPWRQHDPYSVTMQTSRWFKLKLALSTPSLFFEFFARVYICILLVFGYLGACIAFFRKEYKLLIFMIFGVIFSSGYSWLFHIEERVLAVHNWPFGIFAGYFVLYVIESVVAALRSFQQRNNFINFAK